VGTLGTFIAERKQKAKCRTVNYGLQIVRIILNLAASERLDESGLTWIATAPKIKLLPEKDKRVPHPISWDEQKKILQELPVHMKDIVLFTVNTGCRNNEICQLHWSWEYYIDTLNTSAFIIPGVYTKNGEPKLIVLNDIAKKVVNRQRENHSEFVFIYRNKPISSKYFIIIAKGCPSKICRLISRKVKVR